MRNSLPVETSSTQKLESVTFEADLNRLFGILKLQRPSGSLQEANFTKGILDSYEDAWADDYGNVIVPVKMESSSTMFSCHTDTVHPKPNKKYKNKLFVDTENKQVFTDGSSQLGADDGVGAWFMMNMIEAGIAGLYIFHRDEEVGGLGSTYFAENHSDYILGQLPHG